MVSHGNGPQIGLLALAGAAYRAVPAYPLDVLGAETQGMLGYLIEQELVNRLPHRAAGRDAAHDGRGRPRRPGLADPTKPIGPGYDAAEAARLERDRGWVFRPDGDRLRRVVPSPAPRRIVEERQIELLLDGGCVVVCGGGGGIPVTRDADGRLAGVEAVIDKDSAARCSPGTCTPTCS